MATEIKTFEYTPDKMVEDNHFFAIPIYQRLYAWEEDEIRKLLEDLLSSFIAKPANNYFIGNWVIYQNNHNARYDIIDGQQRMTTLWLMGFILRNYYPNWNSFLSDNNKLRLDFIAREADRKFLETLFSKQENDIYKVIDEVKAQYKISEEINPVMVNALKVINEFLEIINNKNDFAKFVFEHTKFVGILLPNGTDLNKYFEVMHNRGVQLEKHEILKVLLLEELPELPEGNRKKYADIWNDCANMNKYIEQNVNSDNNGIKSNLSDLSGLLQRLDNEGAKNTSEKPDEKQKTTDESKQSSILNFPSFLLHTLRLFNNDANIKIDDKDLIDIYREQFFKNLPEEKEKREEKVEKFLDTLLRYRTLFDQFVIKSISKDNDFLWQIRELKESNGIYERRSTEENKPLEVVESFLQVSTQQDIWLSLLMKKISEENITNHDDLIEYLEKIDKLLSTERLNNKSQRAIFEKIFNGEEINSQTINADFDWNFLNQGTSTPRYWFFKLDYLLWKDDNIKLDKKNVFQFRQNRSVEHIHSQSQNNEMNNIWDKTTIDSFGNLALISVNSNSQNYDNSFEVKKVLFKQRSEKYGYESLKLAVVFENDIWTKQECEEHRRKMIELLNNEYRLE